MSKGWIFFLIIPGLFVPLSLLSAQEGNASNDESFLDDSFIDEDFLHDGGVAETGGSETGSERSEQEQGEDAARHTQHAQSSITVDVSVENAFRYAVQRDTTVLNKDGLIYISPIQDAMTFQTFIDYRNAGGWLHLRLDNQFYLELRNKKDDLKDTIWDIDAFIGWEPVEMSLAFSIANLVELRVGKQLLNLGSAFLINPSNPLVHMAGFRQLAWVRSHEVPEYVTDITFPSYEFPRGSEKHLGAWMLSLALDLPWFYLQAAYLPQLNTGFSEFDRERNSVLVLLSYTQWYNVVPTAVFFYDEHPFVGLALSVSVGDAVTLHAEGAVSFENELRRVRKEGRNDIFTNVLQRDTFNYSLKRENWSGVYFEGIAGIQYTASHESVSLFTLLFEVYYNGKGLFADEWSSYIADTKDLHSDYAALLANSTLSAVAALYEGLAANALRLYSPLRVRPLYLMLRLFRDDVLSSYSSERFNLASGLIYSPFDTTFAWNVELEWEAQEVLALAVEFVYYFGLDGGAFTELTNMFELKLYTTINF